MFDMDKNKLYFLSIVSIVALVGIVAMVSMDGTNYTVADTVDASDDTAIAGQAIRDRVSGNSISQTVMNKQSISVSNTVNSPTLEQSCTAFLGGDLTVVSDTLGLIEAELHGGRECIGCICYT